MFIKKYFILAAIISYSYIHSSLPLSERYFQSEIPKAYRLEIKEYLDEMVENSPYLSALRLNPTQATLPLHKQTVKLLSLFDKKISDEQKWHRLFMDHLRTLVRMDPTDSSSFTQEIVKMREELTCWLFSGIDLSDAYVSAFQRNTELDPFTGSFSISEDLDPHFRQTHQSLIHDSQFNGHSKQETMDLMREGNMPLLVTQYKKKNEQEIPIMRSGSLVCDLLDKNSELKLEVDDLFRYYLQVFAKKNKRHLYVSLMRRGEGEKESKIREKKRSSALVDLEKEQNALSLLILDKSSIFYGQKEEWEDKNDAKQFKKQFIKHLFREDAEASYYWPSSLMKSNWKKKVEAIVKEVADLFFADKTKLTKKERVAFIELTNLKLMTAVIEALDVDAVNIACRYGIDRGPSLLALLHMDELFKYSDTIPEKKMQQVFAFLFGPGLFFQNRPIHKPRVSNLGRAVSLLQKAHASHED